MPRYDVFRWRGLVPVDQINAEPFDRLDEAEECVRRFAEAHPLRSGEFARIRTRHDVADAVIASQARFRAAD